MSSKRTYNFGAGPAALPLPILDDAQAELLNWQQTGMSILEVGHRTPEFKALLNHAEQTLRSLLGIPSNYQVLFLGGAARMQFASIPMNLLAAHEKGGYWDTGVWSHMAFTEAKRLKNVYCIASDAKNNYHAIPHQWVLEEDTTYCYYTPNETVNGVRFPTLPSLKNTEAYRVADMTSCLLSEPIDVRQYGLIFAGAQKNIANAGLTLVIIRQDLLEKDPVPAVPSMLNYRLHAEHRSLYATPPVFNCYLAAKMFDWVKAQGGVDQVFTRNCEKAAKLYQYLDSQEFYRTFVNKEARSLMNVCFDLTKKELETDFFNEAQAAGLSALKGHRLVGGIRASLYNAMPMDGVDALLQFMDDFARKNA